MVNNKKSLAVLVESEVIVLEVVVRLTYWMYKLLPQGIGYQYVPSIILINQRDANACKTSVKNMWECGIFL